MKFISIHQSLDKRCEILYVLLGDKQRTLCLWVTDGHGWCLFACELHIPKTSGLPEKTAMDRESLLLEYGAHFPANSEESLEPISYFTTQR
jgi:hypothetical protein